MFAVAEFFGKKSLRSLNLESVLAHASEIRKAAGDRALLRSIHFFKENQRVDRMVEALTKEGRDFADFLGLVNQSGDSSWELLQNISASGRPREQGIALALALTKDFFETSAKPLPVSGACRVHGGGFAGTIQAYIPLSLMSNYIKRMEAIFGEGAVTTLKIRKTGTAELFF
jgi:galactokinase